VLDGILTPPVLHYVGQTYICQQILLMEGRLDTDKEFKKEIEHLKERLINVN
jgi:hypothetical protein